MFKPNREFQAGLNSDETRRRRQNNSLSLRHKDREAKLQTKRQRGNNNNNNNNTSSYARISMVPLYCCDIMSQDTRAQYASLQKLCILLSMPQSPPRQQVIETGIIPRIVQLLRDTKSPHVQHECLTVLLNIASGPAECCAQVIRSNAHNLFIDLLKSSKLYEIKEQAMGALANIAGDGAELKDLLLNNGILSNILLVSHLEFDENCVINYNKGPIFKFLSLLSTTSWAISNLCRTSPPPKQQQLDLIVQCIDALMQKCISYKQNESKFFGGGGDYLDKLKIMEDFDDITANIAWGASYLSGHDYQQSVGYNGLEYLVQRMESFGLLKQFVSLMDNYNHQIRHASSRVIGNLITGDDDVTKNFLKLGLVEKYKNTLTKYETSEEDGKNEELHREKIEICWAISNITSGPIENVLEVEKHGLFEVLCKLLKQSSVDVGKEALWAISHASTYTDKRIMNKLVEEYGLIASLCLFLQRMPKHQTRILFVAFECIENILITGQQHQCQDDSPNQYAQKFEEDGMIRFLEDLQVDKQIGEEVNAKAVDIITKYFNGNDDTLEEKQLNKENMSSLVIEEQPKTTKFILSSLLMTVETLIKYSPTFDDTVSIIKQLRQNKCKEIGKQIDQIAKLLESKLDEENEDNMDFESIHGGKEVAAKETATKAAKEADLNSRLRELRKQRKEKEEQKEQPKQKGGGKTGGAKGGKGGAKRGATGSESGRGGKKGGE